MNFSKDMFTTEHKIPSESFHSYVQNISVPAHEKYHIRNKNKKLTEILHKA